MSLYQALGKSLIPNPMPEDVRSTRTKSSKNFLMMFGGDAGSCIRNGNLEAVGLLPRGCGAAQLIALLQRTGVSHEVQVPAAQGHPGRPAGSVFEARYLTGLGKPSAALF